MKQTPTWKPPPADRGGIQVGKLVISEQLQTVSGNSRLTQGQQEKKQTLFWKKKKHIYMQPFIQFRQKLVTSGIQSISVSLSIFILLVVQP